MMARPKKKGTITKKAAKTSRMGSSTQEFGTKESIDMLGKPLVIVVHSKDRELKNCIKTELDIELIGTQPDDEVLLHVAEVLMSSTEKGKKIRTLVDKIVGKLDL